MPSLPSLGLELDWATEVLVTDRRVIYARGFMQRHTVEINMDKIESVDVDQGIWAGRSITAT
jgi:hypothetical protein